jgi:hypothetical protein
MHMNRFCQPQGPKSSGLEAALKGGTAVVVEFEAGKRPYQNDIETNRAAFDANSEES